MDRGRLSVATLLVKLIIIILELVVVVSTAEPTQSFIGLLDIAW